MKKLLTILILTGCLTRLAAQDSFDQRLNMAVGRLISKTAQPAFTEDFVLADVDIDRENPRRFYNFSGDLSGRYLEVMSMTVPGRLPIDLRKLVTKMVSCQRRDGRFGDASLDFSADHIGPQQMALLWGNGRLLVGLLTYYRYYHDEQALEAAKKLGGFYLNVWKACIDPTVIKRVEKAGATGIICLTQYIEGLVMLSEATGDEKYAATAAEVYPYLPPRGEQHTHGYLTTLRGVLLLYAHSHQPAQLDFVRKAYDELAASGDMTPFGSVREYFGESHTERDEGCATADFIRLSFDLYRQTANDNYLDKGEFALYNSLYFNQYDTGDFGHHLISKTGSAPDYRHAAWWCCTMHGLRALYDIRDHAMVTDQINLYLNADFRNDYLTVRFLKGFVQNGRHYMRWQINLKDKNKTLGFRLPPWAEDPVLKIDGKNIAFSVLNRRIQPMRLSKSTYTAELGFRYRLDLIGQDQKRQSVKDIRKITRGNIQYGPYLLAANDHTDPVFTAEPNDNIIYSDSFRQHDAASWEVSYRHGGYPSYARTLLRPVADQTFTRHGYMILDFTLSKSVDQSRFIQDVSMTEPWRKP